MNRDTPRSHINTKRTITQVPLDSIDPPSIAERSSPAQESIDDLAASIKANGLLQPISINKKGKRFEIIFGHRRYLALQRLGLAQIHAEIHNWPLPDVLIARARENKDRVSVSPWDEASYIKTLQAKLKLTNKVLAKKLGVSEPYLSQRLGIFSYAEILQDALKRAKIKFSVARELNRITDDAQLAHFLMSAIENGATPAVAKRWADDFISYSQAKISYEPDEQPPYNPETAVVNSTPCYFCDQASPYSESKNIWVDRACLKVAIDLLVHAAAAQESEQIEKEEEA